MRRFIFLTAAIALIACNSDSALAPVQTVDGEWTGTQNGYALSLNMTQVDSSVAGSVAVAGLGGNQFAGTVSGTFVYPTLHLDIAIAGFEDASYDGTMSSSKAVINGQLSGSGIANVEVDVKKQ